MTTEKKKGQWRLPPNSHAFCMYSGNEVWIYQVVGLFGVFAEVMYAPEDGSEPWRKGEVRGRWLRGSARALFEALREREQCLLAQAEYRLAA